MSVNLASFSIEALHQLISDAEKMILRKQREQRSEVLQQMRQLASTVGVSFELVSKSTTRKKTKSVAKYRNPKDPGQTWTGRGPKPKWFKQALSQGKKLDDLLL